VIIGFDMDGIITSDNGGWTEDYYHSCKPNFDVISFMKKLSQSGHKIIIYTSRLSNRVKAVTVEWLNRYDVPYDAIHFDKPLYDFMIDDRNISVDDLKQLIWEEFDIKC
jgi:hypothetical protein